MINTYLVFMVFVEAITGFECPKRDGFFADPYNRNGFYQCSNGNAYNLLCPDSLIFDFTLETCVYDASEHSTTGSPSTFRCPQSDGYFVDPVDANVFYECINGSPKSYRCPVTLIFDSTKKTCIYEPNKKSDSVCTCTAYVGHICGARANQTATYLTGGLSCEPKAVYSCQTPNSPAVLTRRCPCFQPVVESLTVNDPCILP